MRVIVLGGTRFIDRAIVEELVGGSHEVMVIHRGETEPEDLPAVAHLHADRQTLPALKAIPQQALPVVLSSADVYRASEGVHHGVALDPVPIDEHSALRQQRYPYRGHLEGMDDYEKLDVEEAYSARNAVILRLPAIRSR